MSATKDFLMEVEEAKEYLERKFPRTNFEIGNNGVHVHLRNVDLEYDINPIPRDDYPNSRRMKGWRLIRHESKKSPVDVGELVPSYEQAAKLLVQDLVGQIAELVKNTAREFHEQAERCCNPMGEENDGQAQV